VSIVVEADARTQTLLRERFLQLETERNAALADPKAFLTLTRAVDSRSGDEFTFEFGENSGWGWQGGVLDDFRTHQITLALKARQLGVSWIAIGYALWKVVSTPGTKALAVSINETEAGVLINRAFDLWESLPEHVKSGVKMIKPYKSRPSTRLEFEHEDGRISSLVAMPATPKAGHGQVATLVLLDEHARHQYAEEGWKAFIPVIADGGQIIIISTANGIGGLFYDLWMNADDRGVHTIFLPWNLHPERDEGWYERIARALPEHDRAEQYPLNPADAFLGTAGCWFDTEALQWYSERVRKPKYRFDFKADENGGRAQIIKSKAGQIRLYDKPEKDKQYCLSADIATGRGTDYSSATVLDLTNANICAQFHGKIDPDLFAEQLHFLGKWFNDAWLAPEMGGGYGEPVVLSLRDGRKGRPPYRKLYMHRIEDRPDYKKHITYGYPITNKTRPQVINQLEQWIRERSLPHMPLEVILECKTFIRRDTLPSPRAAEGTNDDRVMDLAIGLDLYRQRGHHPHDTRRARRSGRPYVPEASWM
jgi:hypothetical protein